VTDTPRDERLAGVPEPATQAEAAEHRRARWGWAEPVVWTDRLVAALESGVQGGRWSSLLDTVDAERTLEAAWHRVKRNSGSAGGARPRVQAFEARAATYLAEIARALRAGTDRPQPVRRVWSPRRRRG
jgi:RNA-directed DNA polymerase